MLLEVRNIHCRYGQLEVIKGVSLQVERASIAGLLGANGSGKSTVMKTISGLMKPTGGEILFDGQRIDGVPACDIVRAGTMHVPEGRGLFLNMTVYENLRMGAFSRRHDRKGIAEDIEKICEHYPIIAKRKNQPACCMSGGEQTQLAIARGLMARPKMLMLDEPLQGLSPSMVGQVEEMVLELNRQGMTILMIEHNVHMTLGMCHKVFILDLGKVIMEGHPKELSESDYVKRVYLC